MQSNGAVPNLMVIDPIADLQANLGSKTSVENSMAIPSSSGYYHGGQALYTQAPMSCENQSVSMMQQYAEAPGMYPAYHAQMNGMDPSWGRMPTQVVM